MARIEKGTTIISGVKGDVFIIPNAACKVSGRIESFRDKYRIKHARQAELNGMTADDGINDFGVETWIVSKEDLHSENVADHRSYVVDDVTGEEVDFVLVDGRIIIKSLIDGKEGDVKRVRLPISIGGQYREDPVNGVLEIDLTLHQLPYRYGRFGRFEEVLEKVCQ